MGKELLESEKLPQDLTPSEVSIIKLIHQFHKDELADSEKKVIRHEFRSLYQKVNLTRLVVLRLLKFEHSDDETFKATDKKESKKEITTPVNPINDVESSNSINKSIDSSIDDSTDTINKPNKNESTNTSAIDPLLKVVSGNFTD